jgi:hypothetical protein
MDMDSGEFFALTLVKWPNLQSREYTAIKWEVDYSTGLSHVISGDSIVVIKFLIKQNARLTPGCDATRVDS